MKDIKSKFVTSCRPPQTMAILFSVICVVLHSTSNCGWAALQRTQSH